MSHSILRTDRVKSASDVSGIQKHIQRETENYANKDIDKSKMHLNYDLINNTAIDFNQRVKKRIENGYAGKRKVRSDAIKLVDGIITSDNKFFEKLDNLDTKDFFSHALEFVKNEFGAENIMYATVHLDEKTPHLHFGFVPLTEDGRLTAKEVIGGKGKMSRRQDTFNKFMNDKGYELKRGESSMISKREHVETSEYKNQTEYHKSELDSVKSDINSEIERLESLNRIAPKKSKLITTDELETIKPIEKVDVKLLNRVDPRELNILYEKTDNVVTIANEVIKESKEKDIVIDELTNLNKKLNDNIRNQAIREENLVSAAITTENDRYNVIQAKYEELTHITEAKINKKAEALMGDKILSSQNKNNELNQTVDRLKSELAHTEDKNNKLHSTIFDMNQDYKEKEENLELTVADNKRLYNENGRLRDSVDYYKWRFERLWDVTKEYLESYVKDGVETVKTWFEIDTREEIEPKSQKKKNKYRHRDIEL